MPKKNRITKETELCRKCYYRWEFSRRNSGYQKDYSNFTLLFREWFRRRGVNLRDVTGYDFQFLTQFETKILKQSKSRLFYFEKIIPYVEAFLLKWGVDWPCRPDFTFDPDEINFYSQTEGAAWRSRLPAIPVLTPRTNLKLKNSIDTLADELNEQFQMTVSDIALKAEAVRGQPKAKRENKEFTFQAIPHIGKRRNIERFLQFLNEIEFKAKQAAFKRRSKRIELKKYDDYLRVWDLKQLNPSVTWAAMARELYPDEYADYESGRYAGRTRAVQRVKDQYRGAERLINGGFQEIR